MTARLVDRDCRPGANLGDSPPLPAGSGAFRLRKWYLDAFDEGGGGLVGYHVELEWRVLRLRAAGLLRRRREGEPFGSSTIFEPSGPALAEDSMRWVEERLGIDLAWKPLAPPARERLLEEDRGGLDWHCELPAARVEGRLGGEGFSGLGYAELVETTLAPWELPIVELRWGRFVSESDSLAWIEWTGPHPLRLAWRRGRPATPVGEIGERSVVAGEAHLAWGNGESIRRGRLGEQALATIRPLLPGAPGRLLDMHEVKELARGTLEEPAGGIRSEGWVVAEVVRWPRGSVA